MKLLKYNGAQSIIQYLEKEGISYVYGVPGEQILALVDAIYDAPSVQFISTRHESGAAFMAEAHGKITGQPAVCIATAGVGASNLTLGIHTAHQDSTPMIAIIGQVNSRYRGREAWQEIDLAEFFSPMTKWTAEVKDVSRLPEIMHQAIYLAKTGRPGPVVLSIPEDVLTAVTEEPPFPSLDIRKPSLTDDGANNILELLYQSQRPLIFAGGGVAHSDAREELLRFSEQMNIPVMSSFRRHDIFPNDHSNYVGNSGLGSFTEIISTLEKADLIFALGNRLSEISTQGYSFPTKEQTVIHLDIDETVLVKQPFSSTLSIVADAKLALSQLLKRDLARWVNPIHQVWAKERRTMYEKCLRERKNKRMAQKQDNLSMERIVEITQTCLPKNSIISSDAGTFFTWFANYFSFKKEQRYLGPTSGAMGYGLPSAIAAKMAFPEKTVVSLSGDGGFMMTLEELETAARYQIPIISIVFNNNAYGAIRLHQEKQFPHRVIGSDLQNPPFDELIRLFKGQGYKIQSHDEFQTVLQEALKSKLPTLIEIPMDIHYLSASSILKGEQLVNM